jgi:membrane fusion protein (multidrug efflux system)
LIVGPDGKVQRKNVNASESYRNDWIITSGLAPGDQVIVSGLQAAREGGQAKGVPRQPAPSAATPSPGGNVAAAGAAIPSGSP